MISTELKRFPVDKDSLRFSVWVHLCYNAVLVPGGVINGACLKARRQQLDKLRRFFPFSTNGLREMLDPSTF